METQFIISRSGLISEKKPILKKAPVSTARSFFLFTGKLVRHNSFQPLFNSSHHKIARKEVRGKGRLAHSFSIPSYPGAVSTAFFEMGDITSLTLDAASLNEPAVFDFLKMDLGLQQLWKDNDVLF